MAKKKTLNAALAASAGAAAGAAALAAKKLKAKGVCPLCEAKRLLRKLALHPVASPANGGAAAQTPPMGWSSWNLFERNISEQLIEEIADAMEKSGLAAAGYRYVNIDDCWQSSERDANGRLQADKATFPSGIRALAEKVNAKGLKLGIYSSNGERTCEDYPASLRHEAVDADTFASWGVEYFKYDFCHNRSISGKAPLISGVELSRPGEGAYRTFAPSDAVCKGRARVFKDDKGRAYLTGLDARLGSFSLNAEAQEACEVTVTLTVQKPADTERFVRLTVNGKDEYHLYAPKMRAPVPDPGDRRIQTTVRLQPGVNTLSFDNPVASRFDSAALQYQLMGRELKRAAHDFAEKNGTEEKPIVYSICEWGFNHPWKWGRSAGNLWRTTGDIKPVWASVMLIYEINVRLWKYAAPGGWNDPDMLEVGVGGKLTEEESRSHFTLWCMMAAPLILGNDVRTFVKADGTPDESNKYLRMLTNETMIAVDQDALGQQCRRIKIGLQDVLVKPLSGARAAVCVFNKTNRPAATVIRFDEIANEGFLQLPKKESYRIYDVWDDFEIPAVQAIQADTAPHGVRVFIIE